jgi:hypothetical protein
MVLNEATVGMFRSLVLHPEQHGLPFPTLKECFEVATSAKANHLLYEDYLLLIENRPLPKVIFYILMTEVFGPMNGKDEKGNLGYLLSCISQHSSKEKSACATR